VVAVVEEMVVVVELVQAMMVAELVSLRHNLESASVK
jgi:hypothetical protein